MKPRKPDWDIYEWKSTYDREWQNFMPREFWTPEARMLFWKAIEAGFIGWYPELDILEAGRGITKGQLAYWCKRASTYLGLDRGKTTSWKPFEVYFNGPGAVWCDRSGKAIKTDKPTPLKASLWCLKHQPEYDDSKRETNAEGYRLDQVADIDAFFDALEAKTNDR